MRFSLRTDSVRLAQRRAIIFADFVRQVFTEIQQGGYMSQLTDDKIRELIKNRITEWLDEDEEWRVRGIGKGTGIDSCHQDYSFYSERQGKNSTMLANSWYFKEDIPREVYQRDLYDVGPIGYKLHLDCVDGDIPVSAILSSASLHDSQAAIPLAQMSSERVTNLYDLMDAVYDSPQIHAFSKSLGHRPIADNNPRRGEKILMDPATKSRFAERSSAGRVNSNLKDNYGGRNIRVKGASKVMAHLMFGIVSITALQLYRLLL